MSHQSNVAEHARRSYGATGGGLAASFVTLLCCAGAAPVLGALSAAGLGFLINDAVLIPLLLLALSVTGWGLFQGHRCHGRGAIPVLGIGGSIVAVGGLFWWIPVAFVGFAAVVAAGVWNAMAVRVCSVAAEPRAAVSEPEG